jgi:hypothetical protein
METETSKRLVMVSKSGPAFSVSEINAAHAELDQAGVPRFAGDIELSLTARIAFLRGQLESLRHALGGVR